MNAHPHIARCSLILLICALPTWADGKLGTATIKGKITVPATQPVVRPIGMAADPVCAAAHTKPVMPQGKIIFSDGSLPYAFVFIKEGIKDKYAPPEKPLKIDQTGCMYSPHVAGMICGQSLQIVNSDAVNHNIHALPTKNNGFNFGQPKKGMIDNGRTFKNPEVMVQVKCDVHPWMSAYVGVLPHPFFNVTQKGGTYEIKNVPAGKYKLAVWHEEWSTKPTEFDIEVKDGETVVKDIELAKK